jgi:hypothetical protein
MDATFELRKHDTQSKPSHLFLLRIWPDETGSGELKWEGKIQHVLTGETEHFDDWATLTALIQSMLTGESESITKQLTEHYAVAGGNYWGGRES